MRKVLISCFSILMLSACNSGNSAVTGTGSPKNISPTPEDSYKIYSFTSYPDLTLSTSSLVEDSEGNFYGTTQIGGTDNKGTVFRTNLQADFKQHKFKLVHAFKVDMKDDGSVPFAGLVRDSEGNFYGTTNLGGKDNKGTVFKIAPDGDKWKETVLHEFGKSGDGANPEAALVLGTDGNLYGTTKFGGKGLGTVFTIKTDGTNEKVLYSFELVSDGRYPTAGLVKDDDGNFYGTTNLGGKYDKGTVFQIAPGEKKWDETVLHDFGESGDGANPEAALVLGTDGNFYGTTNLGGKYDKGTVFKIAPDGDKWKETVLYDFGKFKFDEDGANPKAALVLGTDGNLYGTTANGGSYNDVEDGGGTLFTIKTDGTDEKVLHSFGTITNDGTKPRAAPVLGTDGNLYGTTAGGGEHGGGTVFSFKIK